MSTSNFPTAFSGSCSDDLECRSPARTAQPVVRKIVHLRWKQRLGPVQIAGRLGMAASTVHAVLTRCRINRLSHIDRATGEPIRRYEHATPGAMLHVDVKKYGNVPDGGGWRYVGRAQGDRHRQATARRTTPVDPCPQTIVCGRQGSIGHGKRMTSATGGPMVRDTTTRHVIGLRVHRWLMAVGALLTAVALLLLSLLPSAPSEAIAMAAWVERGHSLLLWSDELLFFAVICWGAGARGLFGAHKAGASVRINVGVTALAAALLALVVLLLAVGRLVYPVFEIQLSAEVLALVVSSTYGALHLAFLGFAVAAVALSWSTRAGLIGRAVGVLAAASFIAGSFPWLTPNWWNSLVAVLVAAWGVFLALATVIHTENPSDATE